MQLIQFELQEVQEEVPEEVVITDPVGQAVTQEPLTKADPATQAVQAVALQAVHEDGQLEHTLGLVVGYVVTGQAVRHEPL